jgi:hypothetical protein
MQLLFVTFPHKNFTYCSPGAPQILGADVQEDLGPRDKLVHTAEHKEFGSHAVTIRIGKNLEGNCHYLIEVSRKLFRGTEENREKF